MTHLKTTMATDWPIPKPSLMGRLMGHLFEFMQANPDDESLMHRVVEWWIEFDDHHRPGREIGLDETGQVIIRGPDDRNDGFWLDTHMTLDDFEGVEMSAEAFEAKWRSI